MVKPKQYKPTPPVPAAVTLSPEEEQQFELELSWCIHQIRTALLHDKKLAKNTKQTVDHVKALKTLTSDSAPLVKKRQVMRASYGDYRSKMAIEDRKFEKLVNKMKVKPAEPSVKSTFIRRSPFVPSTDSFKFDFVVPEGITHDESKAVCTESQVKHGNSLSSPFIQSKSNFKFNFDIPNEP